MKSLKLGLSALLLMSAAPALADVKLAYVGEISGQLAVSGGNFRDGVILAVEEINADTRKLSRNGEFENLTSDQPAQEEGDTGRGHGAMPLRSFADQRRAYLLSVTE